MHCCVLQTLFGSGHCWLYTSRDGYLHISTTPNQDSPVMDSAHNVRHSKLAWLALFLNLSTLPGRFRCWCSICGSTRTTWTTRATAPSSVRIESRTHPCGVCVCSCVACLLSRLFAHSAQLVAHRQLARSRGGHCSSRAQSRNRPGLTCKRVMSWLCAASLQGRHGWSGPHRALILVDCSSQHLLVQRRQKLTFRKSLLSLLKLAPASTQSRLEVRA